MSAKRKTIKVIRKILAIPFVAIYVVILPVFALFGTLANVIAGEEWL